MNSKYMEAVLTGMSGTGKTGFFTVYSKHGDILGSIKWFFRWRQYCFYPANETIYSKSCLKDIEDFIAELMNARRKQ